MLNILHILQVSLLKLQNSILIAVKIQIQKNIFLHIWNVTKYFLTRRKKLPHGFTSCIYKISFIRPLHINDRFFSKAEKHDSVWFPKNLQFCFKEYTRSDLLELFSNKHKLQNMHKTVIILLLMTFFWRFCQ